MSDASNSQYRWSGSLLTTNIRALYERCQRVRLTGLMRLRQGDQVLEMMWIGGEPIEGEAEQGTRSLPLWSNGEFIVEQRMPDFRGQLTQAIDATGSLRAGMVQAIYKLCSDNVLSADVDLTRASGEAAQVRFSLGKAESATINRQTESALTALSKLSGWVDGTYRVVLRPLLGDTAATEAPANKGKKPADDKFDLTGSVNIDVSRGTDWPPRLGGDDSSVGAPVPMDALSSPGNQPRPVIVPPKPSSTSNQNLGPAPAPAPGMVVPRQPAPPPAASKPAAPAPVAAPAVSAPPATAATVPMSTVTRDMLAKQAIAQAAPAKKSSSAVVVGLVLFILMCAVTIGVFLFLRKGGLR